MNVDERLTISRAKALFSQCTATLQSNGRALSWCGRLRS